MADQNKRPCYTCGKDLSDQGYYSGRLWHSKEECIKSSKKRITRLEQALSVVIALDGSREWCRKVARAALDGTNHPALEDIEE